MPVVDVKNLEGRTVGQLELADDVFAAKVNPHLLHELVRNYLARQRAGTHKTKERGSVAGSGRKLWRQKGTGRARVGSIRSPLWRKGGTVHGPVPRSYAYRVPRRMVLAALRSALSAKLAAGKVTVVAEWALESHKTKPFRQALTKLDGTTRTILLVEHQPNVNLERASRNLEGVKLVPATSLEPYDLLRHEHLMLSKEAALKLSRGLSANKPGEAAPVQIAPAAQPAPKLKSEPSPAVGGVEARKAKTEKPARAAQKAKPAARARAKPKGKKD